MIFSENKNWNALGEWILLRVEDSQPFVAENGWFEHSIWNFNRVSLPPQQKTNIYRKKVRKYNFFSYMADELIQKTFEESFLEVFGNGFNLNLLFENIEHIWFFDISTFCCEYCIQKNYIFWIKFWKFHIFSISAFIFPSDHVSSFLKEVFLLYFYWGIN